MTPQQLKDTANKLYKESKFAEAIPFLKSAAEALPEEEALWQQLAYCHRAVENQPQRGGSNPASLRCLFDRVFEVEGQESVGGWIAG